MRVYFDSSAFAKRYVDEQGSADVLHWCDQASELALSVIAVPELVSAFCRLQREGLLSAAQYRSIKSDLLADIADALICDTSPLVVSRAVHALENHPLRGMDAIHLGAAIACEAAVFISADLRQCSAARALGLRVVTV
jgi:predicted nucleic acid-binding protein